jgi:hypothetical protein
MLDRDVMVPLSGILLEPCEEQIKNLRKLVEEENSEILKLLKDCTKSAETNLQRLLKTNYDVEVESYYRFIEDSCSRILLLQPKNLRAKIVLGVCRKKLQEIELIKERVKMKRSALNLFL